MNFTLELKILLGVLAGFNLAFFLSLAYMFSKEKERMAVVKSLSLLILFTVFFFVVYLFSLDFLLAVYLINVAILIFSFLLPLPPAKDICDTIPSKRIDERNTMFSRNELKEGSLRFKEYYDKNPDKKAWDELFRKEPGLLKNGTRYYHKEAFAIAENNFDRVELLYDRIVGSVENSPMEVDTKNISHSIKKMASDLGALDVGITLTKEYHFYSHKGRREEYNNEIIPKHSYAIAFTVEMDAEMVGAAPQASITVESSKQYLNAGTIAVNLAEKIRDMGYDARAHIDGNYQVVCPLVARDAGLGEIGRMGILMTPDYGPRIRIGVVTTDLELEPDDYKKDHAMLEFCKWCKKCAESCPGQSISHNDPELIDGLKRWQTNQEFCFTFWCKAGTDCGRCMAVCPYSHPNHSWHKLIRFGIKKSKVFRYLAVYMDDFFYGRKPGVKRLPF